MTLNVLTYGTFDLFHVGHVNLLERASGYGIYLFVGLSTNQFNLVKKKNCVYSFKDRKRILESCRYVDFVFPEKTWLQKAEDIEKYEIDTLVMGDDWKGKFDYLEDYCDVVYLPRTKGISTTKIKGLLK